MKFSCSSEHVNLQYAHEECALNTARERVPVQETGPVSVPHASRL